MDLEQTLSGFLSKKSCWGRKNCILNVQRITLRQMYFLFEKIFFFVSFGHWPDSFWSSRKTFQQVSRKCILRRNKKTSEKISWKVFFLIVLYRAKIVRLFIRKVSTGLSNSLLQVRKNSMRKFNSSFLYFFWNFRTLSEKCSVFWQNFFGRFVKTAIYMSIEKNREEIFDWSIFLSHSETEQKILGLRAKLFQ